LDAYPEVAKFLKTNDRVRVKYKQGQKPMLVMFDEHDNIVDHQSLTGWTSELIHEYLDEHLPPKEEDKATTTDETTEAASGGGDESGKDEL